MLEDADGTTEFVILTRRRIARRQQFPSRLPWPEQLAGDLAMLLQERRQRGIFGQQVGALGRVVDPFGVEQSQLSCGLERRRELSQGLFQIVHVIEGVYGDRRVEGPVRVRHRVDATVSVLHRGAAGGQGTAPGEGEDAWKRIRVEGVAK